MPPKPATVHALSWAIDPDTAKAPSIRAKARSVPAVSVTATLKATPICSARARAASSATFAPAYVRVVSVRTSMSGSSSTVDGWVRAGATAVTAAEASRRHRWGDGVRSGQDRGEGVVELAGVVEHALAECLWGPDVHRTVGVGQVAA